jgi:hypothetical protein
MHCRLNVKFNMGMYNGLTRMATSGTDIISCDLI